MDQRLFFILGDIAANLVVGVVAGLLCALLVSPQWPMFPAMIAMMFLGMAVALILFFPLGIFFGAMEVMVPTMLSGMVSGMVVGMWAAMSVVSPGFACLIGAACGVVVIALVWLANAQLRGPVKIPE